MNQEDLEVGGGWRGLDLILSLNWMGTCVRAWSPELRCLHSQAKDGYTSVGLAEIQSHEAKGEMAAAAALMGTNILNRGNFAPI